MGQRPDSRLKGLLGGRMIPAKGSCSLSKGSERGRRLWVRFEIDWMSGESDKREESKGRSRF